MILTLKELADYLKVHERTVLRMLKSGQIQGTKIGGQWRFNGSQIDTLFFPGRPVRPDEVPLAEFTRGHLGITLSRVMRADRLLFDLKATDGEGVLRELSQPILTATLVLDGQDFITKLLDRERLLSTGIGNGIAIPHPRDPLPTLREPAVVVFGRSLAGVDFGALDNSKVHLFYLLCCQNIELHLHLMGRLARLLRDEAFLAGCRTSTTSDEILRMVLEHERADFLKPE
ncbi:MAG: hypothetical protein A3K19_12325 [Lentisphaerae bacterium RIFOXYB12_FULL_65_16]|nr:MAG: hypothetical protein A3K18_01900 [Lentisphaerae bacterium RIFOXYA12_64_32]OGV86115.1 MAG: hypothetical protein A3K19_12325 [Lentisphaerae bacterium RIFOXYB12_FULL_65_16]